MIGKIEGNKLILHTRANPHLLARMHRFEGRRTWLKGGGLQVLSTKYNIDLAKEIWPDLQIQKPMVADSVFDVAQGLQRFKFKREPDPHQKKALEQSLTQKHFALFLEQGTGKTKVALDRSQVLFCEGQITGVLIVTKKGVHRQWIESELEKDVGVPYLGHFWNKKKIPESLWVQGDTLKFLSVNYDALRSDKTFVQLMDFCKAHQGKLHLISDESQCIKTHTSDRHKRMVMLRGFSSHRLILTGTPIAKDLTDEWAQLQWLDDTILGMKYLTTFRSKYCIMGGFEGRAVVGQQNMDDFRAKVDPYSIRITKEQIGYIPKRYGEWLFDLTREQKSLIKKAKEDFLVELGSGDIIDVADSMAVFAKIQQIANGFIIDGEQNAHLIMPVDKNPRAIAMMEWLEANEGKAVVWTRFIADRMIARLAMEHAGIKHVIWEGSDDARANCKASFIQQDDVRVFLANPQSAGTGLDGLQTVCTQALYYSNGFNSIDRWQSEDRIDRRGMIGGSRYTDLIGKGSLDRYILRNLQRKKGISAMSLGDVQNVFDELI